MLPIIFLIIISVFVYRTARDNGYNAVLWTVATAVGFFVVQLAVGLGIGIFLGLGITLWGWSPTIIADYQLIVGFIALVPAFILVWLIWRHVNVIRDDGVTPESPPPPPVFDSESRD